MILMWCFYMHRCHTHQAPRQRHQEADQGLADWSQHLPDPWGSSSVAFRDTIYIYTYQICGLLTICESGGIKKSSSLTSQAHSYWFAKLEMTSPSQVAWIKWSPGMSSSVDPEKPKTASRGYFVSRERRTEPLALTNCRFWVKHKIKVSQYCSDASVRNPQTVERMKKLQMNDLQLDIVWLL